MLFYNPSFSARAKYLLMDLILMPLPLEAIQIFFSLSSAKPQVVSELLSSGL